MLGVVGQLLRAELDRRVATYYYYYCCYYYYYDTTHCIANGTL